MQRRNLRVTDQLMAELEGGRFDSALTQRIIAGPSVLPRLLRATYLVERGLLAQARADVEAALEHGRGNPIAELASGLLCFATHDYQRALDRLSAACALGPKVAHRARQIAIGMTGALGWEHDVRAWLEQAIAAEPEHASWHAQAVRLYVRARWWSRALEHAERALALQPEHPSLWMERAGLHAALDQREAAASAIEQALAQVADDERTTYLREGGRVAIEAGEFALARRCFGEALARAPHQPDLHVRLGELASWAGDHDEARAEAERALALQPEHPAALRLLGGLAVLAAATPGVAPPAWDEARGLLERALAGDPTDHQAHVWLAELYLRTRAYSQAHAQLHHASMNAGGFLFVAWLLRFLVVEYEHPQPLGIGPNRTEEFDAVLRELVPGPAEHALEVRSSEALTAAVEAAFVALRGNRSIHATHVVEGRLARLHARSGCRYASRWALQLLRVASPSECLAELDAVVAAYPGSALPACHRGELHLWLGNWAEARRDLERAIELVTGTRWAYMGLSTLDLLEGEYERALEVNAHGVRVMKDSEGPAIYVFRGEAKRKLGRLAEALAELEQSVAWHPARASATINLALTHAALARHDDLRVLWRRLVFEQAEGLMSDAAHELGLAIVGDGEWEPDLDTKVRVLEHALRMMGGNRSSGLLTYWTRAEGASGKRLRFVQHWPQRGRGAHETDRAHARQARDMLLRALAAYSGPREP
jgi:tetratricopeptide (TPR) repeat protein